MRKQGVIETLEEAHVRFELLPHRHTESAAEEARALHLPLEQVAKTLVVRTPAGYLRVLLPANERLDLAKVRAALGVDRAALVGEDELAREYPEFELGAVPPLGGARSDPVLVDVRLSEPRWIAFEAGRHDESLRLRTADLAGFDDVTFADVCRD
jgi:Ala-tRNA(Pro) deacylase